MEVEATPNSYNLNAMRLKATTFLLRLKATRFLEGLVKPKKKPGLVLSKNDVSLTREAPPKKIPKAFGHCPFGGGV